MKDFFELRENKDKFIVKYSMSKKGPIRQMPFHLLAYAKKFLADKEKEGYKGIISKGGKPVKESVELDEVKLSDMGIHNKIKDRNLLIKAIKTAEKLTPKLCAKFWRSGSAKIALKCPSEEVMMNINAAARELKLVTYVVRDAGRTQIAPGSKTVCAIGPAPVNEIDKITGRNGIFPLKLM